MSELDGLDGRNGSPNAAGDRTKGRRESRAKRLPDVETLSFEDAQAELDSVVATLEAGDVDLDHSLVLYERGVALARRCQALLDSATLRVERLRVPGNESAQADRPSADIEAPTDE